MPRYITQRNENLHPHKICKQIFIAAWFIIANSEQVSHPDIHWGIDEHNVVYPYNGLLSSHKEMNFDTTQMWHNIKMSIIWYDIEKSWKHYDERSQSQKTI